MARNGSGTYSLPTGNPVVTGTTISSTVNNNTMSDIADALTASVAKDGQTVMTGALDFNGNEIILDADGDTSIRADTDDQIDIKISGADDFQFTANTFTAHSGSKIVVDDTTDSSSTTTGSIQTDGGLGVAKKAYVGDNVVIATSGKGIDFSATSNSTGTTTSELFADYEEGTFTPSITDGTNTATAAKSAAYTKIGNRVFVQGYIAVSNLGSVSGDVYLGGLPFTSSTGGSRAGTLHISDATGMSLTAGQVVSGHISNSETRFTLSLWDSTGGQSALQASELSTGSFAFSGQYTA